MNFKPLIDDAGNLAPWVAELKNKSGVYVIRTKGFLGSIKYIGESHTDALGKTLMRHFQQWKGATAGPTFDRRECEIAVFKTQAKNAIELQNALIAEFLPEKNTAGKPGWLENFLS